MIAGDAARPDYELQLVSVTVPVDRYIDEVARSGSPGYSAAEIAGMDAAYRGLADQTLIDTIGLQLSGVDPGAPQRACRSRTVPPGSPLAVSPSTTPIRIINREPEILGVNLARFGDPPGSPIGSIYARSRAWLTLPFDDSSRPWLIVPDGRATIRTCS